MLIVVGGHSRNIGKTSVAAGIIRAIPEARWAAVKVTQHGHGICSAAGEPCGCAMESTHPFALSRESAPDSTDSGRFLAAGAARSYWLRTRVNELGHALPELHRILSENANVILESNSAMQFFEPDLYLVVLDPAIADFKDSVRRYISRAGALVNTGSRAAHWSGVPPRWFEGKPVFDAGPPDYSSPQLVEFVRRRFQAAAGNRTTIRVEPSGSG